MFTAHSPAELKQHIIRLRQQYDRIAFVPTMGCLHAGHLKLVEVAKQLASAVIVSIYVNPLQFGEGEDCEAYPRMPDEDYAALEKAGIELLFTPSDADIYPRGQEAQTTVEVPGISDILCGTTRPGHFRGVTTVVNRLLHLVTPDLVVFGKKDYQQLLLIRLMVDDFGLPVEIVGVDTVREPDGLAMSSRNYYLTQAERAIAPRLYALLQELRQTILDKGHVDTIMERQALESLTEAGFRPEYVCIRRQADLALLTSDDRQLVILAAAKLGKTRLIDNLEVAIIKD